MKLKKRKKSRHLRGTGTHGWGARKKHQGSGHRGGFGMAGTGKRADHKKSLIIKLYGTEYFGKQGVTSRSTKRRINKVMNLGYIEKNLEALKRRFGEKEGALDLSEYKILGEGELSSALKIKALAASEGARKGIAKAGGKIILPEKTLEEKETAKKIEEKEEDE